jgi:hypothetical protein
MARVGKEEGNPVDLTPTEQEDYEERLAILLEDGHQPDNVATRQQARREIEARGQKEPVQEKLI